MQNKLRKHVRSVPASRTVHFDPTPTCTSTWHIPAIANAFPTLPQVMRMLAIRVAVAAAATLVACTLVMSLLLILGHDGHIQFERYNAGVAIAFMWYCSFTYMSFNSVLIHALGPAKFSVTSTFLLILQLASSTAGQCPAHHARPRCCSMATRVDDLLLQPSGGQPRPERFDARPALRPWPTTTKSLPACPPSFGPLVIFHATPACLQDNLVACPHHLAAYLCAEATSLPVCPPACLPACLPALICAAHLALPACPPTPPCCLPACPQSLPTS
jgi:hypothetical protein